MNLCVICGAELADLSGLCAGHTIPTERDWARANRLMCDLIHRQKTPAPGVSCAGAVHESDASPGDRARWRRQAAIVTLLT